MYPPMEHLSNDHEDGPTQHENGHKQCDETGYPVVNIIRTFKWKESN